MVRERVLEIWVLVIDYELAEPGGRPYHSESYICGDYSREPTDDDVEKCIEDIARIHIYRQTMRYPYTELRVTAIHRYRYTVKVTNPPIMLEEGDTSGADEARYTI